MSHLHFKFLTGDVNYKQYGGKWVSKKLNNGDFDYWLVLDCINMHDATGDENQDMYDFSLYAVSPSEAAGELENAFRSCGIDEMSDDVKNDPLVQVEALSSYGTQARVWTDSGNNWNKLMIAAHKAADLNGDMLFGFAMDGAQNRIGSTGWDFIRGDLLAGLKNL